MHSFTEKIPTAKNTTKAGLSNFYAVILIVILAVVIGYLLGRYRIF